MPVPLAASGLRVSPDKVLYWLSYNPIRTLLRFMLQAAAPSIAKLLGLPMFAEKPSLFLAEMIERTVKARRETGERRGDIIDVALEQMDGEEGLQEQEKNTLLLANILLLFLAGFDTVSISLSLVVHWCGHQEL